MHVRGNCRAELCVAALAAAVGVMPNITSTSGLLAARAALESQRAGKPSSSYSFWSTANRGARIIVAKSKGLQQFFCLENQ
jgi:hypothetical protein